MGQTECCCDSNKASTRFDPTSLFDDSVPSFPQRKDLNLPSVPARFQFAGTYFYTKPIVDTKETIELTPEGQVMQKGAECGSWQDISEGLVKFTLNDVKYQAIVEDTGMTLTVLQPEEAKVQLMNFLQLRQGEQEVCLSQLHTKVVC